MMTDVIFVSQTTRLRQTLILCSLQGL